MLVMGAKRATHQQFIGGAMSSSFAMRFSAVAASALAVVAVILALFIGGATQVSRHADGGDSGGSTQTTTTDPSASPDGHGWID
jgi:hypothetical protein